MKRLTFSEKYVVGSKMLMLLGVLSSISYANGWLVDPDTNVILDPGDNCQTPAGGAGICKEISTCEPYAKKTVKYSALRRCSFIGGEEITCCPTSGTPATTTKSVGSSTSTPVETVVNRNVNERPSLTACNRWREFNPAALTFHILDGVPVAPGDYPHMGGLIFPVGGGADIDVRCGCSLISEQYVLTAAHCVNDPVALPTMVRFGVVIWNATADDNMLPVDVEIENITMHTLYQAPLRYHDIAIIKLRRPVEFSPFIRPACLNADMADVDSATPLVVIGWGVTNVQTRARSEVLLMTNVTTVPLNDCNATHVAQGVQRTYRFGLNEGHYCAYDAELNKDACQADSGGPLQLVQNKESTIVGVVSFGLSCASVVPSVYARVAFYLDWIESIVWPS